MRLFGNLADLRVSSASLGIHARVRMHIELEASFSRTHTLINTHYPTDPCRFTNVVQRRPHSLSPDSNFFIIPQSALNASLLPSTPSRIACRFRHRIRRSVAITDPVKRHHYSNILAARRALLPPQDEGKAAAIPSGAFVDALSCARPLIHGRTARAS